MKECKEHLATILLKMQRDIECCKGGEELKSMRESLCDDRIVEILSYYAVRLEEILNEK